jgi:hypothetical protein
MSFHAPLISSHSFPFGARPRGRLCGDSDAEFAGRARVGAGARERGGGRALAGAGAGAAGGGSKGMKAGGRTGVGASDRHSSQVA